MPTWTAYSKDSLGNNSWISTDERDAVREIGAQCISDMYTRIGIREGPAHRGGVDWNDVEFVEEGIGLEEVNLIPEGHPEERSCSGRYAFASTDCQEVPTSATNNLEISMFVKEDETYNTRFNKLANSGQSDFTVAMNVTNMTSATMMFTFPYVDGLRMANWTIQDDGIENLAVGSIEEIFLPDGSVRVSVDIQYDKEDYPMIRNIFFDMTTSPPETNDFPVWTSNEPADGTIVPMLTTSGNEVVAISGETMEDWATDNDAWGLDCQFAESGWSSRMNSGGELLVNPGSSQSSDATCHLVDPYGALSNASHTWRFGEPASFSVPDRITRQISKNWYTDSVNIESEPSLLVQNLALTISASQSGSNGPATNVNLGSTQSNDSISLSGISPGPFMVHVIATSPGMLDWEVELDFEIEKENTPPVIDVDMDMIEGTYATWSSDQYSFTLTGTAKDPDGGPVSLSATMCGETSTGFTTNGDAWTVSLSIAKCVADGFTQYGVDLRVEDSAGDWSAVGIIVPDPYASESPGTDTTNDDTSEESGGLPSIGIFATITAMLGAALLMRRD